LRFSRDESKTRGEKQSNISGLLIKMGDTTSQAKLNPKSFHRPPFISAAPDTHSSWNPVSIQLLLQLEERKEKNILFYSIFHQNEVVRVVISFSGGVMAQKTQIIGPLVLFCFRHRRSPTGFQPSKTLALKLY
jgi:hypothetical protein